MIKRFLFIVLSYSIVITIFFYVMAGIYMVTNNIRLSLIIVLMIAIGTEISYDDKSDKL